MDQYDLESFTHEFRVEVGLFGRLMGEHIYPPFSDPHGAAMREESRVRQEIAAGAKRHPTRAVEHYNELIAMRTILVNLFAAGLYHLFEQQMARMLAYDGESTEGVRPAFKAWAKSVYRIDVDEFAQWRKISELKLVANVVKHAEGDSEVRLRKLRPELFDDPLLREPEYRDLEPMMTPTRQPLAGADFYVIKADFDEYASTLDNFWIWFEERVKAAPPPPTDIEPIPF